MEFKRTDVYKINKCTDLIITDTHYVFGDNEHKTIFSISNEMDGLYYIDDVLNQEEFGSFGVDSATVGVMKVEDVLAHNPNFFEEYKSHLYTVIPKFRGEILNYEREGDYFNSYMTVFVGHSNRKKVELETIY